MIFWFFMLTMTLLIPVTMIGFGKAFLKQPPKEIHALFGYRTSMSMKNADTWEFAHKYCGKIWFVSGLASLPLSLLVMLFVIGKSTDTVGTVGGILCIVPMIPLAISIALTEKALKKNFDQNGYRR